MRFHSVFWKKNVFLDRRWATSNIYFLFSQRANRHEKLDSRVWVLCADTKNNEIYFRVCFDMCWCGNIGECLVQDKNKVKNRNDANNPNLHFDAIRWFRRREWIDYQTPTPDEYTFLIPYFVCEKSALLLNILHQQTNLVFDKQTAQLIVVNNIELEY